MFERVKKAYFHQYSNGKRELKIWNRYNEITSVNWDEDAEYWVSRFGSDGIEILKYCQAIGFQAGTYPIDNRTEEQLRKDWEESILRNYQLGMKTGNYEDWKAQQVLSF